MNKVAEYVVQHTIRGACQCGQCIDAPPNPEEHQPDGHTVDMVFFEVARQGDPDPDEFRALIEDHREGEFCELDPFDGVPHSYLEIGAWIGDQGLAMMFMALGKILGLWEVLTPQKLGAAKENELSLAGKGLLYLHSNR